MKHLQEELQRLQRNKERRHAREKQKSISHDVFGMSPPAAGAGGPVGPSGKGGGGTQRKCANCGQVGHIKTNKKSVNQPILHPISSLTGSCILLLYYFCLDFSYG